MKQITFDLFLDRVPADQKWLDRMVQADIFEHQFEYLPDIIRGGKLYELNSATIELLASYLEGKVKTEGKLKRKLDKVKDHNCWEIGKIYEELAPNYQNEKKRLLIREICKRCEHLRDSRGKQLSRRNIMEYRDLYELKKSEEDRAQKQST